MAYTTPQTGTASIEDGKSIILFLEAQRPNGRGYIKKQSVIDESKIVSKACTYACCLKVNEFKNIFKVNSYMPISCHLFDLSSNEPHDAYTMHYR